MSETTELEVRCCCMPDRLYGWLQVPEGFEVKLGAGLNIPIRQEDGRYGCLVLTVEKFSERAEFTPEFFERYAMQPEIFKRLRNERFAFKFEGDDMTGEEKRALLRRIRGFREYKHDPTNWTLQ